MVFFKVDKKVTRLILTIVLLALAVCFVFYGVMSVIQYFKTRIEIEKMLTQFKELYQSMGMSYNNAETAAKNMINSLTQQTDSKWWMIALGFLIGLLSIPIASPLGTVASKEYNIHENDNSDEFDEIM